MAFDKLCCFAVGICVPVLHGALGFIEANAVERPSIDLGDISSRPVAQRVPFERFFEIHDVSGLEFSPDARTLYFLRNDGHVDNVFAIDLVDRRTRQVTAFREPVHRFLVGRRGKYLIIAQDIAGNERYDLYRFDLNTGETLRLTKSGAGDMSFPCDLSPDGAVLYYGKSRDGRSASDLWRLELQTGEKRVILPASGRLLECGEASPDGHFLLFREFVENNEKHLGILDLYTGKARYIMRVPGVNNVDAGFSQGRVYFLNAMGSDGFRLWQYQIGAPLPTLVKIPIPHPIESLSFQADGQVVVVRYRDKLASRTEIFVDHFRQSSTFGFAEEDIVGAMFSRTEPKIGVIVTAEGVMPPRYFLLTSAGLESLYDSNQSGIEPRHLTKVRSIRVPSFDGLKVPVHLFIPNGTSAESPRPAIFWIHGGPEEHVNPIFDSQIPFLANRGFIVVAPNVRGSTGFGKQYALLDDGDWGGGHIRDIVEIAGFVRDLDFVDGDKLFIVGESFGGFSVLSLITQYPDVFRAAVDISGMSELATFVDSWPAYVDSYVLRELGFDPRHNATRNQAVSPLYHVDRIRIPLQIHQGLNDRRVPKAQSDRMVEHMRRRGLSVEYHVYEDEGHGFSRFSNEQTAFNRISDFFDRHVR